MHDNSLQQDGRSHRPTLLQGEIIMNLLQYNNQRILLVDIDGKSWFGMAYYCDADTNETEEDALTVKVGSDYIEFLESDIQSVKIN